MDTPIGPDACHCFASRRASRALARLYDRHLAPTGLSISQFSLLSVLAHNPDISMADLAEIMVMERTTLIRALRPLHDTGLVDRRRPERGRVLLLSATKAGLAKVKEVVPLWEAAQRQVDDLVGADRASRLRTDSLSVAQRI
jgi:DNA-binding MarR family transcriptional regulator